MAHGERSLICRVLSRLCALPLEHVLETMRPLPVEPMAGAPRGVAGVAIVRGAATPVVDLGRLLADEESRPTRFVTVRTGDRHVALAVDSVVGIRTIPTPTPHDFPPLLRDASSEVIAAIGTLDAELLLVLRSAHLVPEAVWHTLDRGASS